ncbi:TPA: prophage tail fiber N-terminal domain-containing protein [Escherichia coli]|nr:prophage tail fiber N-terminal domain-containing protein [Escherichia coli]
MNMAVKISGVLKDGAGKPVQNCTIQLKAKRNSTTVVVNTVASENPDEAGRYSMDVEHGQYSVILLVEGFPPSHAGTITVYEDSQPGTLNDFLGAMTEDDARPEALRRFEVMVEEVARNASAVAQNTAAAKKSASDAGTSAREAATHATDAAGSARAASTSAGQAATSAQSASSSAGTASTKATEASKSAAAAESSKSAAATSAGAAKTSETNAAASQKSAATSASTATTKASEAATSARDAAASKEAAKSSETNASSSASSAASSATAAGNSAKAAKTSETNADNSAQAAAASQTASANSATAAKKSETNAKNSEAAAKSSETNAKASETNAKSSETNAAKSAADALNYRNQAQVIVGDNIGLGSAPRDCPDISGNPSGYIGFMRIMASAKGFPSIASGESSLTGFISQVDGSPAYTGIFQGWASRSLYTYRWSTDTGPQWTRHARKDEVNRLSQWGSETWLYNSDSSMRLGLTDSSWGCYSDTQKKWIPLDVYHGGTGAATIDGARTNLGLGRDNSPQLNSLFLDRTSDSTGAYTTGGMLHTRLLANDNTVRLAADMYVQTFPNEQGRLTIRFTYGGSAGATKYLDFTSEGNLIVDSAILKSTVEKPLQINSANPAIRFNETDRPANTPTYTLIANGGNWFIHKSDYDDAGSTSTAISYNFANDRLDVKNLKASGHITCETINQSSDRDLKDNIQVIGDATEAIRKMNGYTYTLKENGLPYAGVIAQEVMEALPEAVGSFTHYGEALQGPTVDGNELREETRYLNVDYAAVTGLLVQVARETDDRVTALEEENTTLRENLATADTRISTLENQVSELVALVRQLTGSEH